MTASGSYFNLHLVSDSTGEMLITVARAVAAQFSHPTPALANGFAAPPSALRVLTDHEVVAMNHFGASGDT